MKTEELFDYRILATSEFSLAEPFEPDDWVKMHRLSIQHSDEDDAVETLAGVIVIYEIPTTGPDSIKVICDAHSAEAFDVYEALYEDDAVEMRKSVLEQFEDTLLIEPDRFYVYHACILAPEFRGQGLAAQLTERVFSELTRDTCFVLAIPSPIIDRATISCPEEWMSSTWTKEALQSYWQRQGFRRIGNTDVFGKVFNP